MFEKMAELPKDGVRKAMSSSINEALKKGKTEFKRKASSIYNMKATEIAGYSDVKTVKPNATSLEKGKLIAESRRLTIGRTHFASKPAAYKSVKGRKKRNINRTKTKVKIKKDVGFVPFKGGFIANPGAIKGGNTMVWVRLKEGKRKPIAPVRTISVAQMLSNKEVYDHVSAEMEKKYLERLEHQLDRQLTKIGGRQ